MTLYKTKRMGRAWGQGYSLAFVNVTHNMLYACSMHLCLHICAHGAYVPDVDLHACMHVTHDVHVAIHVVWPWRELV